MNTFISKKFPIRKLSALRKKLLAFSCKLSAFRNLQPTRGFTLLNPAKREFRQRQNYLTGFTLVEMLVSISVFLVVMLVAASSLLSIIDGNAKAQSLKSAINNLNFALESMQKNIRVGTDYSVSGCSPANTCISFTSYKDSASDGNDFIVYRFNNNGSIERCVKPNSTYTISDCTDANYTRLTAPEVHIEYANFYPSISGTENPRVLIVVGGYAGEKQRIKTKFNLQTTVSQRPFN